MFYLQKSLYTTVANNTILDKSPMFSDRNKPKHNETAIINCSIILPNGG